MIRVELPHHLRTLAQVGAEVQVSVRGKATIGSVLDAVEDRYPMLRGAIRDHGTGKRRAFVRFYVTGKDWSHEAVDAELPAAVASGSEPVMVVGAIAGG